MRQHVTTLIPKGRFSAAPSLCYQGAVAISQLHIITRYRERRKLYLIRQFLETFVADIHLNFLIFLYFIEAELPRKEGKKTSLLGGK